MSEPLQTVAINVTVNGKAHQRNVEPRQLLVEFIREELRLTGTHIGCDTSYCGACTVLLDGTQPSNHAPCLPYRPTAQRSPPSRHWKKRGSYIPCNRHFLNNTACNAGIAHRGCSCLQWRCLPKTRNRMCRTFAMPCRETFAAAPATRTSSNPYRQQP